MMKLFDTHCHYEDPSFDEDRDEQIEALRNTDVRHILNCCSDESVFDTVLDIAHRHDFAYCSLGIHPHWCLSASDDYLVKISKAAEDEKVRAIGEIGLDYYFDEPPEVQKQLFEQQLQLACDLNMPVIIHDRLAHEDVMEILKKYQPKGILHRYGGPLEILQPALKWGMYVSINTDITQPYWLKKHSDILFGVPIEQLLVETDAPYAPVYGSKRERAQADDVYFALEKVAEYRHIDLNELAAVVYESALEAYGL